jgi:hypothetical protein
MLVISLHESLYRQVGWLRWSPWHEPLYRTVSFKFTSSIVPNVRFPFLCCISADIWVLRLSTRPRSREVVVPSPVWIERAGGFSSVDSHLWPYNNARHSMVTGSQVAKSQNFLGQACLAPLVLCCRRDVLLTVHSLRPRKSDVLGFQTSYLTICFIQKILINIIYFVITYFIIRDTSIMIYLFYNLHKFF